MIEPDEQWERHGECDACGYCCEVIASVDLHFDNLLDDPMFLEVRGISPTGHKSFHIIDPCSQLQSDRLCRIYAVRPQTCIDFPATPEQVKDVPCTYWFKNKETGEIIAGTRATVVE